MSQESNGIGSDSTGKSSGISACQAAGHKLKSTYTHRARNPDICFSTLFAIFWQYALALASSPLPTLLSWLGHPCVSPLEVV